LGLGFGFAAAFFGLSSSSSSASLSFDFDFFLVFFLGVPSVSFVFPFTLDFFLAGLVRSRSPLASEAVAAPSFEESLSLGEPESETDAWKSSTAQTSHRQPTEPQTIK
jgi:hypothetical protein